MSKHMQITLWILIAALFCLIIGAVSAAPDQNNVDRMKETLQNLSAKGYDVSAIQAALDSGNNDNVRTLMEQFWQQHPEARPPVSMDRLKQTVQNLSAKGFDVSSVQSAIDSGDATKASQALNQFWQAHPDARPAWNGTSSKSSS